MSRIERDGATINRRAALGAMVGAIGAAVVGGKRGLASSIQSAPTAVASGECSVEPGAQLLIDWRSGLPVIEHEEIMPPVNWQIVNPSLMSPFFLIPPDWEVELAWAESFTSTGVPIWTDRPPQLPQLSLSRLISADRTAVYDYVNGIIQGPPLSLDIVALVAKQGILGENPRLTSICAYDDPLNPVSPGWFHADRYRRSVLISSGVSIGLPGTYQPATSVNYTNLYGPRETFEELMRTVFIRVMYQQLGGGSSPTPTPTPDF